MTVNVTVVEVANRGNAHIHVSLFENCRLAFLASGPRRLHHGRVIFAAV